MTEGQGLGQSLDTSSSTPVSSSQPVSQPAQTATEERRFNQSDVDSIVKRVKHEAVDTYRRQQSEQPQYAQQKYGETAQSSQLYGQQTSNPTQFDDTRYRQIAAEEAQRLRDQWLQDAQTKTQEDYAQRTVSNFFTKINTGKEKYQDFDKVTADIEYGRFPNVVQLLAEHVDNSSGVLYELGKDRIKMANLEVLAEKSPRDAIVQAQRLSQSIRDNEAAGSTHFPNEPLSQMKPTNTGTDSGQLTIADFRKKYRG